MAILIAEDYRHAWNLKDAYFSHPNSRGSIYLPVLSKVITGLCFNSLFKIPGPIGIDGAGKNLRELHLNFEWQLPSIMANTWNVSCLVGSKCTTILFIYTTKKRCQASANPPWIQDAFQFCKYEAVRQCTQKTFCLPVLSVFCFSKFYLTMIWLWFSPLAFL